MPTKRQTKPKPAARKPQRTSADILADLEAARAKIRDAHAELHILRCPEDARIEMPPAPPPAAPQLTFEQQKQAEKEASEHQHRENMAEIASRLHEITYSVPSRRLLGFMNILRDENGCATPFEEFIVELVTDYAYGRGVTPDDVENQLKDFRESFDMAVEAARLLTAHYPEVIKPASAAA